MIDFERKVIKKIKKGNQQAFKKLYDSYADYALRSAYAITRNQNHAADIVQETFIKVYRNIESFDEARSFKPWFYQILLNESRRYMTKQNKQAIAAFKGFIPDEVLYRKKLGFLVPIKHWLKDELYTWARQLIVNSTTDYIIDKVPVLRLLERHRQNKGNYARKIWTILMFMVWHQIYIEQAYNFNKVLDRAN